MQDKFSRTIELKTQPELVWSLIEDIVSPLSWISIIKNPAEVEYHRLYSGVLEDKIGPFRASADMEIQIEGMEKPAWIKATARGEDRQLASRISVDGMLKISENDDGSILTVEGNYEITGRPATLGASAIRKKAARIMNDFFSELDRQLGA